MVPAIGLIFTRQTYSLTEFKLVAFMVLAARFKYVILVAIVRDQAKTTGRNPY